MKGLIVAIQFLTRLPTPRISVSSDEFAASMRWFPAVGLIVGAFVAGAGWAGARIDPWTGALAALIVWVAVTGALHLDGLGDIADASGAAHKDRARLIAVLGDPHVGSFAVVAIALQLIAKLVLLHALLDHGALAAIALVPFAARIGPLIWSRALPDLHAGLGSRFRDAVRPVDFLIWSLAFVAAVWISPSLLTAPLVFLLWGWWLIRRIGGISGDGHGAGIEIGESTLLAAALLLAHVA
ncbi:MULTISPECIES: adenosylcobinamide-GDP ribazoletransferase [unclassified Sphingopyxis]|jgi:adenosylcobinamide-GDP ribazoletransferase|uniref:adenosylcobinamide-GDP ribazoletransferase n=1 Tax=unclassified Sphingopyxis TaxID=2614943 RepID=UPI0006C579DD|nr:MULTISPECIES: adenosylcobinamide-GDP ribazoletransferase [unclassified Sphingopyxis]USI76481.1 adenosylcobinamide-GDP ribazoletransferase [Sphingopyxis sp. USTB-05]GAO76783.1 cobalamin synthase [Sphingopyxis sp. C-1]